MREGGEVEIPPRFQRARCEKTLQTRLKVAGGRHSGKHSRREGEKPNIVLLLGSGALGGGQSCKQGRRHSENKVGDSKVPRFRKIRCETQLKQGGSQSGGRWTDRDSAGQAGRRSGRHSWKLGPWKLVSHWVSHCASTCLPACLPPCRPALLPIYMFTYNYTYTYLHLYTHIYIYIYIHVISHVIRCMNYLARSILDSLNNIWSTKKIEVAWNTSASQYQRWAPNSQLLCCCIDQFELVCNFNLQPVICWSGLGGCTAL